MSAVSRGGVPLHVHSCHSPLWGVPAPGALVARAAMLGYDTLALTDRNGLYGLYRFLEKIRNTPIKPIIGAEIHKNEDRALCWVRNATGYRNLCRLLSDLHGNPERPLEVLLARHREGLVVASDRAPVLAALARDSRQDLYVEVSPGHAMHRALALARACKLPPLATVRAVGLDASDLVVHRALRAIAGKTTVFQLGPGATAAPGDLLVGPERLAAAFPHCPEAVAHTRRVAEACDWDGPGGALVFPCYRGLAPEQACQELRRRALDGVRRRYGEPSAAVAQRLEKELALIRDKGFASYFLVVGEIVAGAPLTCGRGSAAASLVAYALGITHVDPLRHNLFFERFLHAGRQDPPDIDVDFPWDERDGVLAAVFQRYGPQRVARVANQVGFQWRGALREVARAYGMPADEIRRVEHELRHSAELGAWAASRRLGQVVESPLLPPPWPEIIAVAARLGGHLRHLSVHCGGVVIAPDDIRDHAPVQVTAKGVPLLQWEKEQTEAAGLVKIDLLGNRSLAVIRDTLEAVAENTGHRIDYAAWKPLADPATGALVRRGETLGCFYIESPATRLLLRRMWSDAGGAGTRDKDLFEHLVMASSIIRPAANRFIRAFVARMHGAPWQSPHPLLAPVLDETYGIAIYQEQVTRIAMALAGFDATEGDALRKVLSKKHPTRRLVDLEARFAAGARARGVSAAVVDGVWQQVLSFSGYSFCKPHSASYALVSLKCAYLKAHYPAEFLAAVLSNRGGYYQPLAYISEARRLGLAVHPPCVDYSGVAYRGRGQELRVGLLEIRGLSREGARAVVAERQAGGPYRSLEAFHARVRLRPEDHRALARVGAFDGLCGVCSRSDAIMQSDLYQAGKNHSYRTLNLFEDQAPTASFEPPPPSPQRLRRWEWETLGFPVSFHPLEPWRERIRSLARRGPPLVDGRDLERHVGRRVRTVGWWVTGKVVATQRQEPMEFVSFEDTTAGYEVTLFPEVYRRVRRQLTPLRPYLLQGKVEAEFGVATLTVERLEFLDRHSSLPKPPDFW